MTATVPAAPVLPEQEAATYAEWFASLAEPTRVRLLHTVATTPGGLTVGRLTELLGISQSTCSHHVRKLADVGFLKLHKEGTSTRVVVNEACCVGLPHAADAVMGLLAPRPCCPPDVPADITVRALQPDDWPAVRRIYGEGIATGIATFETAVPSRASLDAKWLPDHRWVAELDGEVVGWTALSPVSTREYYAGVAESSIHVADGHRGNGIGKALIRRQVVAADEAGLWTLQTAILTENRAGIALHHQAGYRTVGIRERIAQLGGTWHDTVLIERRADTVNRSDC
ncbi:helix-turn-helix domain-containing GNAT family N-acetyltransferase [Actinophytocola algeriensis]|uniref:L-amino acid N-acyltransferase YncA/DNA-binding transcriptional ArsR family regulator n=1 Tax=Actinophytocola algeriensis TaxID=1768010 RepID=A0A7W7VFT9_9PSEU|nr:GNAT family N-acetyltransferase [Actinophytocola algeriensis]MBB4908683.1 L-amino acid N-acyltransferase YncA/DNA-binding transcriptional ArsR family regulator [Actinophytocola algeriensis]MBE1474930.1 L-amino acid N-acyltransferase YncA/DNA-binding transcriptional ArsR family regulator [Actinophytocola algeriensis]